MIKLAQDIPPEVGDPNSWGIPSPTGAISDLPSLATHALNWLLGIAGFLAVIAIIYAGFMYVTSGGDSNQAEKAKKNLTWAIVGIILVALSAIIVNTVQDVLNRTATGTATVATNTPAQILGSATTNAQNAAQVLQNQTNPAGQAAGQQIQAVLDQLQNGTITQAQAGQRLLAISAALKAAGISSDITRIADNLSKTGQVMCANTYLEKLQKTTDPAEAKKIGAEIYALGTALGASGNSDLAKKLQDIGAKIQAGADLAQLIQDLQTVLTNTNNQSSTSTTSVATPTSNPSIGGNSASPSAASPTPTVDFQKPTIPPTSTPKPV